MVIVYSFIIRRPQVRLASLARIAHARFLVKHQKRRVKLLEKDGRAFARKRSGKNIDRLLIT